MLIEVRGAGGSGKSTLVRRVMGRCGAAEPLFLERAIAFNTLKRGRLIWDGTTNMIPAEDSTPAEIAALPVRRPRPLGYRLQRPGGNDMVVLGSYEKECGGADTIPQIDLVYELVRRLMPSPGDILLEGLLIGKCAPERVLAWRGGLFIVQLTITPEEALDAMNARRAAGGKAPFTTDSKSYGNLVSSYRGSMSSARRLREAGKEVLFADRETAFDAVVGRLGLADAPETDLAALGIGVGHTAPTPQQELF